jgi:hypothetical protein
MGDAVAHFTARSVNGPTVLEVWVDGRVASHAVVPPVGPIPVAVALGRLSAGSHSVRFGPMDGFAPADVDRDPVFVVGDPSDPGSLGLRHAPVLFGRVSHEGPFQNVHTDIPLLAWHSVREAAAGHRIVEFCVLWSHEDEGTDGPTLMARWGRTTDIEWVYRVTVNRAGDRVPGTAAYQGRGHSIRPFAGRFEHDHPLLQVCTANNMLSDRVDGVMRFALAAEGTIPAGRAREVAMELNPWTFRVSSAEVEPLVERSPEPEAPGLGDPRQYLYLELPTLREPSDSRPSGLAVGVRLLGDPTVYRSDHGRVGRTIVRGGPVSTAVKLPRGSTPADVEAVVAFRVPRPRAADRITVDGITRGFFLDHRLQPGPSFVWGGRPVMLTRGHPEATLWERSSSGPPMGTGRGCPRPARPRPSLQGAHGA